MQYLFLEKSEGNGHTSYYFLNFGAGCYCDTADTGREEDAVREVDAESCDLT